MYASTRKNMISGNQKRPITDRLNSPETSHGKIASHTKSTRQQFERRRIGNQGKSISQVEQTRRQIQKESFQVYSSNSIQETSTQQLNDMVRQIEAGNDPEAAKLNQLYHSLMMEEDEPPSGYEHRRKQIAHSIKSKNYWPDGMKHP